MIQNGRFIKVSAHSFDIVEIEDVVQLFSLCHFVRSTINVLKRLKRSKTFNRV